MSPFDIIKAWGMYVVVLKKTNGIPLIYIGSGTSVRGGVSTCLRDMIWVEVRLCLDMLTLLSKVDTRLLIKIYSYAVRCLLPQISLYSVYYIYSNRDCSVFFSDL